MLADTARCNIRSATCACRLIFLLACAAEKYDFQTDCNLLMDEDEAILSCHSDMFTCHEDQLQGKLTAAEFLMSSESVTHDTEVCILPRQFVGPTAHICKLQLLMSARILSLFGAHSRRFGGTYCCGSVAHY